MIDYFFRPLAGLLLCGLFAAALLGLPTAITHIRAWVGQIREGNLPAPVLSLIRLREEPEAQDQPDRKAS